MRRITAFLFFALFLTGTALAQEAPPGELTQVLTGTNAPGSVADETPLGDVIADAAAAAADCGAALIPGGLIAGNLQAGPVYAADIAAALPADAALAVAVLTEAELRAWLENGLSRIVVGEDEKVDGAASAFDGFLQVSGLRLEYDPSAPVGARVFSLELAQGLSYPVRVCVTEDMARGGLGFAPHAYEPAAHTLRSAVERYFSGAVVNAPETGRCVCVGTADNTLARRYPALLFVFVAAAALLLRGRSLGKRDWLDV